MAPVMRRIVQLPPDVAEKVAAGEVVERPASVLKELLENALDAGATRIDVTLRCGGKDLIRVQDDGAGIPAEELPLAVARYATSKIAQVGDLWRIATFGFRGEALASIGHVAELTITSRPRDGEGASIRVADGQVSAVRPAACAPGTLVEVRHLFFSVPARRKFLRRDAAEFARAAEWVRRTALGAPGVGLRLEHEAGVVWNVPSDASLPERIAMFFGPETAEKLRPVALDGPVAVKGVVGHPDVWRTDRRDMTFYVNGRFIRDPMLGQALSEAFRGTLVPGRFPFGVLCLCIDPGCIDVNVHPAKAEIRYADGRAVFQAVLRAVRSALDGLGPRSVAPAARPAWRTEAGATPAAGARGAPRGAGLSAGLESPAADAAGARGTGGRAAVPPGGSGAFPAVARGPDAELPAAESGPAASGASSVLQVGRRYLVCEGPAGIEVFDQHALHEKILFTRIRARLAEGALPMQCLLMPVTVRLAPEESLAAEEHAEVLARLGLSVDVTGPDTVRITAVPAWGRGDSPETVLREVLPAVLRAGAADVLAAAAARLACALAVKSGAALAPAESTALIAQARGMPDMATCPHGRPTGLHLSYGDLEKYFDRK